MKKILPYLAIVALAFSGTSCELYKTATTGVNLSASGDPGIVNDDQIVVNSERLQKIGLDTFDLFLQLDYDNQDLFVNIGAHQYAKKLSAEDEHGKSLAKRWIDSLKETTRVYKKNRTKLNHANLNTAIKTVQEGITQSQQYIDKSGVN